MNYQPPFAPNMYPNIPNIPFHMLSNAAYARSSVAEAPTGSSTTFCSCATKVTAIQPESQKQWIGKGSARIKLAVDGDGKSTLACFIIVTARFAGKFFIFAHTSGYTGSLKYVTAVPSDEDGHYTMKFSSHNTHPKDLKIDSVKIEDKRLFYFDDEYLVPAFNPELRVGIVEDPYKNKSFVSLHKKKNDLNVTRWKIIHGPISPCCVIL